MPSKRPFRITRDVPGGINPGSFGRKAGMGGASSAGWTARMGASGRGAKEVLVKISGGGRDADGVQAHFEYIDRHGKLDIETDHGEVLHGKTAAAQLINDWALDYGAVPGAPHSRSKVGPDGKRREPRQAFNIVLSMPAGTAPQKVLQAVKKFAREEFAHQHRYAMALHSEEKGKHGMHPHVHLVVKAEHEYDGSRLNPRKADLQRWRERFAEYLTELGVAATATRREDRGFVKTHKKTPIYRAAHRKPKNPGTSGQAATLTTAAGDSVFMRRKLEAVKRELRTTGTVEDRDGYRSLMNVRAKVNERYGEAIHWLRQQGREEEARRFELMQQHLPQVRSEKQMIADAMVAQQQVSPGRNKDQGRAL
jgi:diadenosine tetraphosphate (Ap4A) HIT family hydrolase